MQQVRLQYAKEEETGAAAATSRLHDVSPSAFVTMALEVEEQQCVLFPPPSRYLTK